MDPATHNKIVSFIWGLADHALRDRFKRGKYPDVILPICVIRRMDTVLEPTKQNVLDNFKFRVMHQGEALSLVTRSIDGQILFLANMASKVCS